MVATVRNVLTRRPPVVVLDLSEVTAIDSATLPMLVTAAHVVALCDGRLRTAAGPGSPAFHAIIAAGLSRRLQLCASVEIAFHD
jgi:anti-anti-sigma regulatory factor